MDIKYTSRTLEDIKNDIISDLQTHSSALTYYGEDEVAIAMIEILAGVSDTLHFYLDRQTNEQFLNTARLRKNIVRLSHMLGYRPKMYSTGTGFINVVCATPLLANFEIPAYQKYTKGTTKIITYNSVIIPTGFVGTYKIPAFQGELRLANFTSTGEEYQSYKLPTLSKVSEQLFRVLVNGEDWYDLLLNNPLDADFRKFFYIEEDQKGNYYITFKSGRADVPLVGQTIQVMYINTDNIDILSGPITADSLVLPDDVTLNCTDFSGNKLPETLQEIRDNAIVNQKTHNRAVTFEDYVLLAKQVAGVKEAVAFVPTDTLMSAVNVYISSEDDAPSEALLNEVTDYLTKRKMITTHLQVYPPVDKEFSLKIKIGIKENYIASAVISELIAKLKSEYVTNRKFGKKIQLKFVYAIIQTVEGIDDSIVEHLYWTGNTPSVNNLTPLSYEYPILDMDSLLIQVI